MKTIRCAMVLVFVLTAALTVVEAGSWDGSLPYRPYQGPKKDIHTLIVTGNYTKARLLAELIQADTGQPILLLPAKPGGMLFFVPAKDSALEVEQDKFSHFVKFVNPKRVLIIGDSRFVPDRYADQIDPSQTVWRVQNRDWNQIAGDAAELLDLSNLKADFKRLAEQLDSGRLYRPSHEGGLPKPVPAFSREAAENPPVEEELIIVEETIIEEINPETPADDPVIIRDTEVVPK